MKMIGPWIAVIAAVGLLAGCVTTSSGGMPEPASAESRVKARLDLARGYINARVWSDAKRALMKALEIDNRSVEAHVLLALVYEAEGEPHLAENNYKKALRLDRSNSQALNNYGTFLFRAGRTEEAIDKRRAVVADPDYRARPQAYENLGLAERALGDDVAARSAFERAISLNPNQARSSLELADIAYTDGRIGEALQHYDRYTTLARQSPRSLCLGMKISAVTNNPDQVASYGMALKNLYSDSAEARSCQIPNS